MERTGELYADLDEPGLPFLDTHNRHMNVLPHLLDHLGQALPGPERQRISVAIEEYRARTLLLMAPVFQSRFLFT